MRSLSSAQYTWSCLGLALFVFFASPRVASSEDSSAGEDLSFETMQQVEITGMSTHDVVATFGEPDSRSGPKAKETWHYGDTLVFISNDKVAAFVDSGELAKRRDRARFQKPKEEQPSDALDLANSREWKNDWTTAVHTPAEDVVDELVDTQK